MSDLVLGHAGVPLQGHSLYQLCQPLERLEEHSALPDPTLIAFEALVAKVKTLFMTHSPGNHFMICGADEKLLDTICAFNDVLEKENDTWTLTESGRRQF